MEEKNYKKLEWSDVVATINGKALEGFASMMYHVRKVESEQLVPKLESVSLSGHVKFSRKQMREIKKYLIGKKVRIPRKIKKKLKKQNQKLFEAWCEYYFPFTLPLPLGMFGCVVGSEKPKFHYNSSIFGKRMVK